MTKKQLIFEFVKTFVSMVMYLYSFLCLLGAGYYMWKLQQTHDFYYGFVMIVLLILGTKDYDRKS